VTGTTTLNGAVAVNNSAITFNNVLGDKLNLFGGFGFGINGDNLTAYIPGAGQRFSLRTGNSSGTEVFFVTGGGNTSVGGTLTVNGGISGTSANINSNTIDINGVIARTYHADSFKSINNQGAHLQWNREVGVGRTYLINQKGLGVGGISFGETTTANAYTQNMLLDGSGNLYVAGFVEANTFNARSDRRLKKNITAQENNSVLERLEQLQTYSYEYINTPSVGRRIGVIAQEIQGLFPEVVNTQADGMMSVDYGALGAMAAMGVGQLNSKFKVLDGKVNLQGEKLLELDGKVAQHNTRIGALESWKTEAVTRMDGMQSAIDLNIQKIAENTLAIQTNTKAIERLDDALFTLDGTVKGNTESIASINARWARNFTASEDGSSLTVNAVELKVSNFTAQQVRANSVYSQRLEAEMARIAELEVNNLRANTAVANTVQAEQVNTGSIQVYAGVGLPAVLFAAKADGHYTVSTSALDGSYATATVIVNAGQAKVVSVSSEGIELVAEGNMVKAIAAGKSIKASWIKMG
ncbi:tail fiber domain-containing protein, partial [Limnobacter sp.]|uniref:tail fiber domain-containing protein n=1 Tax=Limnobacter sp. TaxID=2003368 RepID=UPI0027347194